MQAYPPQGQMPISMKIPVATLSIIMAAEDKPERN